MRLVNLSFGHKYPVADHSRFEVLPCCAKIKKMTFFLARCRQSINDSLEDHRDKIQDVITEGQNLTNEPDIMEFVQSEVAGLESHWRKVLQECGDRQDELEHVLDNWRSFTDALYKFKEVLAQGEVELTHRKSVNISIIDIIKAEIEEIKVHVVLPSISIE